MAAIIADIKPTGLTQTNLIDLLYMIVSSLEDICQKLDADGGVTDTDYEALCMTALFNVVIEDCRGNYINLAATETSTLNRTKIISAKGISDDALLELMYSITNCMSTMTTKLDTEALTLNTYVSAAYTAMFLHMVENQQGNIIGNSGGLWDGSAYYFRPGGVMDQHMLVDWLYNCLNGIYTLVTDQTTTGLDGDATVTDTNYAALWWAANITLTVENSFGNRIGN